MRAWYAGWAALLFLAAPAVAGDEVAGAVVYPGPGFDHFGPGPAGPTYGLWHGWGAAPPLPSPLPGPPWAFWGTAPPGAPPLPAVPWAFWGTAPPGAPPVPVMPLSPGGWHHP